MKAEIGLTLKVVMNDEEAPSCSKSKNRRTCYKKSYVEESDEEVPSKKSKSKCQNLLNPKLSWFEENVTRKNIRERKDLEKKLGIDKLADELRKTTKDYNENLDLVYSFDHEIKYSNNSVKYSH